MYRSYEEQNCYKPGNRPEAMAVRYKAQAIAIAVPGPRPIFAGIATSSLLILCLLILTSLIILNLVLILLGL